MVSVLKRNEPKIRKPILGGALIAIGILMWPVSNAVPKLLYDDNFLTLIFYVVALRGLLFFLIGFGISREEGQYLSLKEISEQHGMKSVLIRGVTAAMSNVMLLIALNYIPLTEATAFLFMSPFMLIMLAPILFGEPFKFLNVFIVGIACIGLAIVASSHDFTQDQFTYGFGSALLAAVFMTIFVITNYKHKNFGSYLSLYTSGVCYLAVGIIGLVMCNTLGLANSYVLDLGDYTYDQVLIIFMGAIGLHFLGTYFVQEGFKYTPPLLASIIVYLELFWVIVVEHTLFDGIKHNHELTGLILIGIAGITSGYFSNTTKEKTTQ